MNKFIKKHQEDIILAIGVVLISLISFALGYITAKKECKEPLRIEELSYIKNENSNNWGRDMRPLSFKENL